MSPTLRLPLLRLTRTPRSLVPIAGWTLLALVAAFAERAHASQHAADRALLGAYAGIALPLLAYSIVGAALGGQGIARATRALVGFGAPPTRAARDTLVIAMAVSAIVGATLAALVSAIAHGAGDPPLAADVATSLWIGALGGAAYAAFFVFGATLGKTGMVRGILLAADWVLGSGSGFGALLTPRAHVRNLFGGTPPADLSQRGSTVTLILLALVFGALAIRRTRYAR